jgi:hypothetical protein
MIASGLALPARRITVNLAPADLPNASETALSGKPDDGERRHPGATCTCTSTGRTSTPSNDTVETRWTMSDPALGRTVAEALGLRKNI